MTHPSVTIDSRALLPGQIFFAIKGDHFDGNEYVPECLAKGAAYCISSDMKYKGMDKVIIVPDTLTALQNLASEYRDLFKIPVLGITGSNGKTTTKELLALVLATKYRTHFTKGNLNNHLGVPLTLLEMPANTEFAIIEMGANHVGEIRDLCNISRPDHGFITNIGLAHLEGFGGHEGVKQAKSELFQYLDHHHGIKFLNVRERSLDYLEQATINDFIRVGSSDRLTYVNNPDSLNVCFKYQDKIYESNLIGNYNFNNIVSAFEIGLHFECDPLMMIDAIVNYSPVNNRSQKRDYKGITLLMDAYNANPSSVLNALDNLEKLPAGNKSVVLGDMLELGANSLELHDEILQKIKEQFLDKAFLIGPIFYQLKENYPTFTFFKDTAEARLQINWDQLNGQTVLIKGSRGLKLETLFG